VKEDVDGRHKAGHDERDAADNPRRLRGPPCGKKDVDGRNKRGHDE